MSDTAIEKTYALFANAANRKLVADLKNTGAKVFEFPPLESEKIALDESSIEIINNLSEFDWLIFPDVLAADYFLEHLEANEIDLFEIDFLRTFALGEAIADRLRFVQIHADVIPSTIETEQVISTFVDYVGVKELEKLKILFPIENTAANDLTGKLREKGVTIVELPIYKTEFTNRQEITRLKILLESGAVDEFIFTAPTDFIALQKYFKNAKIAEILSEVIVSAADGVNYQTAREHKIEKVGLYHPAKLDKVNR